MRRKPLLIARKIKLMYCDEPTIAIRKKGINPETGRHYKPFRFIPYRSDDQFRTDTFEEQMRINLGALDNELLILPCGHCLLCTKRYRMHWVLRCMHEARFYDQMCYLTLTVDDNYLDEVFPPLKDVSPGELERGYKWNSLSHIPFQKFMKRLRISLKRGVPVFGIKDGQPFSHKYHGEPYKPIRYFMCGEYGDTTHRPHYHAIIFGYNPPDMKPLLGSKGLYTSDHLSKVWKFGYHTVAKVESACISYVAGYCDKKMDKARDVWEYNGVHPEYVVMSRGCKKAGTGGIGRDFVRKYWPELYPMNDDGTFARTYALTVDGCKVKMPRYYDNYLSLHHKPIYDTLLAFREEVGSQREQDINLDEWLNESHRRCAVAIARRLQREPGVQISVGS